MTLYDSLYIKFSIEVKNQYIRKVMEMAVIECHNPLKRRWE